MPAIKIGFVNFGLTLHSECRIVEKAEEAFASVAEFWDKDLEYFETLTTAESQLIVAEDHHDELFLIDE